MKAWKGIELEGTDIGVMTMFVSGASINCHSVIDLLIDNDDCDRVYLGGGRIDVEEIEDLHLLELYCDNNNVDIVIETSLNGLSTLPKQIFDTDIQIITRIDNPLFEKLARTDLVKIDSGKNVHVTSIRAMIKTNLDTLNNDMFALDVLVYDDAKGGKQ